VCACVCVCVCVLSDIHIGVFHIQLSIDRLWRSETFVLCVCGRARVGVRACNPRKLAKYGTPVRVLCEAVLGYICNMETHTAVGKKLKARVLSLAD
jgi:hypothetical protein